MNFYTFELIDSKDRITTTTIQAKSLTEAEDYLRLCGETFKLVNCSDEEK